MQRTKCYIICCRGGQKERDYLFNGHHVGAEPLVGKPSAFDNKKEKVYNIEYWHSKEQVPHKAYSAAGIGGIGCAKNLEPEYAATKTAEAKEWEAVSEKEVAYGQDFANDAGEYDQSEANGHVEQKSHLAEYAGLGYKTNEEVEETAGYGGGFRCRRLCRVGSAVCG